METPACCWSDCGELIGSLRLEPDFLALKERAAQPVDPEALYEACVAELGEDVTDDLAVHDAALGCERFAQFLPELERRYR